MIDCFGHKINVGWAEHEDLWLEAANTLDRHERRAALKDIAEVTGRSYVRVSDRANRMREREKRRLIASQRRVMRLPAHWSLGPSAIAAPSRERLMAGR
jgi:hypothetical protein